MNVIVLRKQTLHYMLQHNDFRPRDAIHDLSGLFWGVLNARLAQLATRSRAQGLCEDYCLSCVAHPQCLIEMKEKGVKVQCYSLE